MGIAATPTALLKQSGAYKVNPKRERVAEPKPKFHFNKTPPKWFTPEQKKIWREIVHHVAPGVLTSCDRIVVEMCTYMVAQFRESPEKMPPAKIGQLRGTLAALGMTPAGRGVLQVKTEEHDDWKEL